MPFEYFYVGMKQIWILKNKMVNPQHHIPCTESNYENRCVWDVGSGNGLISHCCAYVEMAWPPISIYPQLLFTAQLSMISKCNFPLFQPYGDPFANFCSHWSFQRPFRFNVNWSITQCAPHFFLLCSMAMQGNGIRFYWLLIQDGQL